MPHNSDTPVLSAGPFNNLYYKNKLVRSHLNHDLKTQSFTGAGNLTYEVIANNLSEAGTSWDENNTGLSDLFDQLNLDSRSHWPGKLVNNASDLWTNVPLNTKGYTLLLDSDGKRAIYGVMPYYNTDVIDENSNVNVKDFSLSFNSAAKKYPYIFGSFYQQIQYPSYNNLNINYRASELGMITTFYEIKNMIIPGDIMTGTWSKPYHFISGEPGVGSGNYTASPAPYENKRYVHNLYTILTMDARANFELIFSISNMPNTHVDIGPSAGGDTLYFNFNKNGTRLYYIRSFVQFDANQKITYGGSIRSRISGTTSRTYTHVDGVRANTTHSDYKVVSIMNVLHLDTPWDITSISKHEMKEVFPDNRDKIVAAFSVNSDEKIKTLSRYIGPGQQGSSVNVNEVGYNLPAIDIFEPSYSSSFNLNYIESEYDPTTDGSLDSAFDPVFYKSDQVDILNKSIQSKFFVEDPSKTMDDFYKTTIGREYPLVTGRRNSPTAYYFTIGDSESEWNLIRGGYSNTNDTYPDLSLAYKYVSANDFDLFMLSNPKIAINTGEDNQQLKFVLIKKLKNPMIFADSADEEFGTKVFNIKDDTYVSNDTTIKTYSQIHGNIDGSYLFTEGNYDHDAITSLSSLNYSDGYDIRYRDFEYTKAPVKYIENYYGRFELIDVANKVNASAFFSDNSLTNSTDSDLFEFLLSS